MTLKEAKRLSELAPIAGRKYPRPGYEKLISTSFETLPVIGLDGISRPTPLKVTVYLENNGGTLRVKEYTTDAR